MRIDDIKSNAKITCEQNNVKFNDFLLYCLLDELGHFDYLDYDIEKELDRVKSHLAQEYTTLNDVRPPLEEDEDVAFAVDHVLDIYEILIGEE